MQKLFDCAHQVLHQLSGWLLKKPDVEVWAGVATTTVWLVVRPVGCAAKFSETTLEMTYCNKMNFQFMGKSFGGH